MVKLKNLKLLRSIYLQRVEDGMQLKVSGKGNAAPFDGVNGDLIVLISIEEHDN